MHLLGQRFYHVTFLHCVNGFKTVLTMIDRSMFFNDFSVHFKKSVIFDENRLCSFILNQGFCKTSLLKPSNHIFSTWITM